MRSFILDMTPERWEKLKTSPENFPITEADLPSQPEPGDTLIIRHLLPNMRGIIDLGDCVIAWAEPVASNPHRYRLKVTFNMTPEQVKQRYGCPFTPLSDMIRRHRKEKEQAKLEKARRILAGKAHVASLFLSKNKQA
ncbi:hypothetical protein CD683_001409 [Salmonella enterica subsp. enterica serovar Herston]|uniref:Uncharacterized protein n=3 Tax=Salmonella enterica TaxID=28901 RepID=A0A619AE06_SALET|nr:hypothetical protein [Salmonella enterica]EAB5959191.1 hypothetical protein [Salmonella enterica subsp. enterica serovar Manchester]EBV0784541.1 hypothetical protein [Salmonella enterica subsp. enterica serovar Richmond]EBX1652597.1 hypothetical protein [Salmonella enterica subsp. enterica serovar Cerro]EBY3151672.1 hypothetical protein [Salmonella enterica subsp. enterica serovar Teshie]EBY7390132.1 hypothetical protein [Salmonella enterica subsp. enterica serovar Herston]ECT5249670.1 hyp